MTQDDPARRRLEKHVANVRDFFYHLMTFVFVSVVLVILDRRADTGTGFLGLDWAFWVILPWGLGVAGHAISVFFGDYRVDRLYERETQRARESR